MTDKVLMKGNEALAEAAIRAGCRFFFGYPITPQTELAAYMAKRMGKAGGVYLQAESEIAAINMVYGASAAGKRAMTSSSSPGISLKAEGISPDDVTEDIKHSWYSSGTGLNPSKSETQVKYEEYSTEGKYSYGKAVRAKALPAESGPLSRMLVTYLAQAPGTDVTGGAAAVRTPQMLIDPTLEALGVAGKPEVLVSLLGRVAARNLEAAYVADLALVWVNELVAALAGGEAKFWQAAEKDTGAGVGAWEAPRGSVAHWIDIKSGKIAHYGIVAPTTWDIAPRDDNDVPGPMEQALIGAPIADPERPLEALRIAHSFDP